MLYDQEQHSGHLHRLDVYEYYVLCYKIRNTTASISMDRIGIVMTSDAMQSETPQRAFTWTG